MANGLAERFAAIRSAMEDNVCNSLAEYSVDLGEVHQIDEEIRQWVDHLPPTVAEQLARARRELAMAEHSAASGLYRQAFAGLRLFLELSFAAIYFSANELERRKWLSDRADFSWSRALDRDNGVLSRTFVIEFSPGLLDMTDRHATMAADTYRYCSQFVHGKAAESWSLPEKVEYNAGLLEAWCCHARAAGNATLFLILSRFSELIHEIPDPDLCDSIFHRFGAHNEIRRLIGHVTDA